MISSHLDNPNFHPCLSGFSAYPNGWLRISVHAIWINEDVLQNEYMYLQLSLIYSKMLRFLPKYQNGFVDMKPFWYLVMENFFLSMFKIKSFQWSFSTIFLHPTFQLNYQYCHLLCTVISWGYTYKHSWIVQENIDFSRL